MNKYISILKTVFILIGIVAFLSYFFVDVDTSVNLMIYWSYIVLAIAIFVFAVLPAINMIKNPQGSRTTFIGLLGVIVLVGGSYLLSSDAPLLRGNGEYFTDSFDLKLTDMLLYTFYATLAGTIGVLIYGAIRNSLK